MKWRLYLCFIGLALPCILLLTACDDDQFDHTPPEGMGTMVLDNRTGERITVYLNGEEQESVRAGHHRYYDLTPGVYRVALRAKDSKRSFAGEVDILQRRRTVVDVSVAPYDYRRFDVYIYFD